MSDRAMHFYGNAFGSFANQILDVERDHLAGCPIETYKLVLVLRKLLEAADFQVMHHTEDNYDPSDMCMERTDIMVYRPTRNTWLMPPAVFERLATVVYDSASSAYLPDTPDRTDRMSFGSFEQVGTHTPFGFVWGGDPWDTVQLLLRNAAAAGGYSISFRQIRRDTFRIRAWNHDEVLEIGMAYLTGGHYCGSCNVAIELA